MSEKIHRGKIKTPPDPLVVKYIIQPDIDSDVKYRFQPFVDCNIAHVLMLAKQGIVSKDTAVSIIRANEKMAAMGDKPAFEVNPDREDLYFNIEAYVIEQCGIEIGGQMHTARSRNDLYATTARLGVRKTYMELCRSYNAMRQAIIDVARQNEDAVYSGYTHMQPSEPITFAHYCSAILNAMQRDFQRIAHCFEGLNLCPLGGGSMGSTSWNIDRKMTADLLGFYGPIDNSIDCVATRDYSTDILGSLSIAAITLSRFCQDLYVWATPDYGYVEVSDSCAVCSSIMPQKKNPWILEHIKAKAAHVEGAFMSSLNVMKNVIYSHCEDMCNESCNYLFSGMHEMKVMCDLMTVSIKGLTIHKDRMRETAKGNFCTVTELANCIVRKDKISFRMAHDIVAGVVDYMLKHNKKADEIDTSDVNPIYEKLYGRKTTMTDAEVRAALDPVAIAYSKKVIGGTAPEEVERQLNSRQAQLDKDNALLTERENFVKKAHDNLMATAKAFV